MESGEGGVGGEWAMKRYYSVSTRSVRVVTHKRLVVAESEAEALAIYGEGTAWPSSYDESVDEVLSQVDLRAYAQVADPSQAAAPPDGAETLAGDGALHAAASGASSGTSFSRRSSRNTFRSASRALFSAIASCSIQASSSVKTGVEGIYLAPL